MTRRVESLFAVLIAFATAAQSAPLELGVNDAVERALAENARMAVRAGELAAAQAEAKAAGRLEPFRLSLSPATIMEQFEASILQVLGISGRRKWASRAARHELAATVAGNEEFRLELAAATESVYWRLRIAQERLSVAAEQVALAEAVYGSASRLAAEGMGRGIDVDRARSQLEQAMLERRQAEATIRQAQADLAVLIVVPPETQIVATDPVPDTPPALPSGPQLQEAALGSRPAMRQVGALARAALAQVGIVGSERNPELGVALDREEGLNFGRAHLEVPLIDFGTIKHGKRAARGRARAAVAEVDVVEAEIREEVQSASDGLSAALAAEQELRERLIPRQVGIVERLRRGYEARAVGYLEVLEAQKGLQELRLRWLEAVTERMDALVRIERAVGSPIEEVENDADGT